MNNRAIGGTSIAGMTLCALLALAQDAASDTHEHVRICFSEDAPRGWNNHVTGKREWFSAVFSLRSEMEGALRSEVLETSAAARKFYREEDQSSGPLRAWGRLQEAMFEEFLVDNGHVTATTLEDGTREIDALTQCVFPGPGSTSLTLDVIDDEAPWAAIREWNRREYGVDVHLVFTNWVPPGGKLVKELDLRFADSGSRARANGGTSASARSEGERALEEAFRPTHRSAVSQWMDRHNVEAKEGAAATVALLIQTALVVQGFDPGPRDAAIGPKTMSALAAWRTARGIADSQDLPALVTGILRTVLEAEGFPWSASTISVGGDN